MKKIRFLLSVFFMMVTLIVFGSLTANAAVVGGSCANDDAATWSLDTTTGVLTVTGEGAIYHNWLSYRDRIRTVIIGEGITSIGKDAFSVCEKLTDVQLPSTLERIEDGVFSRCIALKNIDIPEGIVYIGKQAFESCYELTEFTVPSEVTVISEGIFSGCKNLERVYLPKQLTSIGNSAFWRCEKLDQVQIPNTVTEMGNSVFYGCISLKEIQYSTGMTTMPSNVFSGCTSLEKFAIHDGVTKIENAAFYGCTNLTSIHIPEGVTLLEQYAFATCSGLTEVKLPESLEVIGIGVFYQCTGLTEMVLPLGCTAINWDAFRGCTNLKTLCIRENFRYMDVRAFLETKLEKVVYCGEKWNQFEKPDDWGTENGPKVIFHEYQWKAVGDGTYEGVCIRCERHTDFSEHSFDRVTLETPTHLKEGTDVLTCSHCNHEIIETVPKLSNHTYGAWTQHDEKQHKQICECGDVRYADCVYENERDGDCGVCGMIRFDESVKLPETEEIVTDADPEVPDEKSEEPLPEEDSDWKTKLMKLFGCKSSLSAGTGALFMVAIGFTGAVMKKKEF